jgi:Na+/H+ antiporter NhaD/arsenite permease-like protein
MTTLLFVGVFAGTLIAILRFGVHAEKALFAAALTATIGSVLLGYSASASAATTAALPNGMRVWLVLAGVAVPFVALQRSGVLTYATHYVAEVAGGVQKHLRLPVSITVPFIITFGGGVVAALLQAPAAVWVLLRTAVPTARLLRLPVAANIAGLVVGATIGASAWPSADPATLLLAQRFNLEVSAFVPELPFAAVLLAVAGVIAVASAWRHTDRLSDLDLTDANARLHSARRQLSLDGRNMLAGLVGLAIAVLGPLLCGCSLLASLAAIAATLSLGRPEVRHEAIGAVGFQLAVAAFSASLLAELFVATGAGTSLLQAVHNTGYDARLVGLVGFGAALLCDGTTAASVLGQVGGHGAPEATAHVLSTAIAAGSAVVMVLNPAGIVALAFCRELPDHERLTPARYFSVGAICGLVLLLLLCLHAPSAAPRGEGPAPGSPVVVTPPGQLAAR